jgi:Phosphopantetheine attachment site
MTRPAASRSLIRADTLMDSEPLMIPESTGEARAALAAFPGIADVTAIELDAIMVVGDIPVTAVGTVNAVAPPVPELSGLLPYQAPATPGQEVLCELFAQVLGLARRGLGSDFFDLGGRSIEAMVLAGLNQRRPCIRVSMADLYKAPAAGNTDRQLDQMADARK